MSRMYFDVWAFDDLAGTALGELTQAYGKSINRVDQAVGAGQFTINRHDSQYLDGWCAQDNLVRVRLEEGGPWDYDDPRYIEAFFIEEGADDVLAPEEEGGDEITRGGRTAVAILRRAVVNYQADIENSTPYWRDALTKGEVRFLERNPGEVLRILLRNAQARTPDPLEPMVQGFTVLHDSSGAAWEDVDADWHIPIGQDHLQVLGTLASGDLFWRMTPALRLLAYDEDQGRDLTGSVVLEAGVNIEESAERQVHAREAVSRVLVKGSPKDGGYKFRWVSSGSTETLLGGRREGFVEYQATPTANRLEKAGRRALRSRLRQYSGPTSLGVTDTPGATAFTDYLPGDVVTVLVPGEWESVPATIYGIALEEQENGEYDVTVQLEEQPFDPASSATTDGGLSTDGKGGGSSAGGCCPPPPPHQPGEQNPELDAADGDSIFCNSVPVDANRTAAGTTPVVIVAGETFTYRITQTEHSPACFTQELEINSSTGDSPLYFHSTYGPVGPGGSGPAVVDSGVINVPALYPYAGGFFTFSAITNGYAAPNSPPFARDCYRVEIWRGEVDLDATPTPIPPSTGQAVNGESPTVNVSGEASTILNLAWAYQPGSLRIRVDGVLISPAAYAESDPTTGVVQLTWALESDENVTVDYQAGT